MSHRYPAVAAYLAYVCDKLGLPAMLPFKNGFGTYKSPNMEERYPGVQFSQFTAGVGIPPEAFQFKPPFGADVIEQ